MEDEKCQSDICEFVKAAVEDESWRVRKHCSEQLPSIAKHLAKSKINDEILPLYIRLLTDAEPQVRKASILAMNEMVKASDGEHFPMTICEQPLQALVTDTIGDVRDALAEEITCLGGNMNPTQVKEKLLPSLKKLAGDDSPQARLNLCSKLSDVSKMLGIETFEAEILPLLKEVTIDQKWRVRNSIVQNIAQIGIQMVRWFFFILYIYIYIYIYILCNIQSPKVV